MNATKRKFNILLNGMGNKSTTSLDAKNIPQSNISETDAGEAYKRRRISDSDSITQRAMLAPRTTAAARSSAALHQKKSASLEKAILETPKYAPWDRTEFLKRLKSFSNLSDWTPKPTRVNEVEWAKRGWVCQKAERVRCCLCNVEILVKLNRKEVDGKGEPVYVAQNVQDLLVDKYAELIITSHNESCLWRKRGCDDSIFKMPLNNTQTTLHGLKERYDELVVRNDTLPYMNNMRAPPQFHLESALSHLPKDFFTIPQTDTAASSALEINEVACMMTFFGWQGHNHDRLGSQVGSVSCQTCFRILGLWLFKSKRVDDAGDEVIAAAVRCLDVVNEHREYCPWRNSASQNAQISSTTTALSGWEIILRVIKNDHYLRTSSERHTAVSRPVTPQIDLLGPSEDGSPDYADADSIREEEDKKRWARLKRVKSIFDTKGIKGLSRPSTAPSKK